MQIKDLCEITGKTREEIEDIENCADYIIFERNSNIVNCLFAVT